MHHLLFAENTWTVSVIPFTRVCLINAFCRMYGTFQMEIWGNFPLKGKKKHCLSDACTSERQCFFFIEFHA